MSFGIVRLDATRGGVVRSGMATSRPLEMHPAPVIQLTGSFPLSHGAEVGEPELPDAALASSILISAIGSDEWTPSETISLLAAIGVMHAASPAPTMRLTVKKAASRVPYQRLRTIQELGAVVLQLKADLQKGNTDTCR